MESFSYTLCCIQFREIFYSVSLFTDRCDEAREADEVEEQDLHIRNLALPGQRLQWPPSVPLGLRQVRQLLEGPRLRPGLRPRHRVQRVVAAVRLPR